VRYYGVRAGWWTAVLPFGGTQVHAAVSSTHSAVGRIMTLIGF